MSLQATANDAMIAAYAPSVHPAHGTSLHQFSGYTGTVTVQFAAPQLGHEGTSFNGDLSYQGLWIAPFEARPASSLTGMIGYIRQAFGLNIKQLAEVMQVSRVTIYDWMRQDDLSVLRGGARMRLNHLRMLAQQWSKLGGVPGEFLEEQIPAESASLIAILSREKLPKPPKLTQLHQRLLAAQNRAERSQAYGKQRSKAIAKGAAKILANPQEFGLEMD